MAELSGRKLAQQAAAKQKKKPAKDLKDARKKREALALKHYTARDKARHDFEIKTAQKQSEPLEAKKPPKYYYTSNLSAERTAHWREQFNSTRDKDRRREMLNEIMIENQKHDRANAFRKAKKTHEASRNKYNREYLEKDRDLKRYIRKEDAAAQKKEAEGKKKGGFLASATGIFEDAMNVIDVPRAAIMSGAKEFGDLAEKNDIAKWAGRATGAGFIGEALAKGDKKKGGASFKDFLKQTTDADKRLSGDDVVRGLGVKNGWVEGIGGFGIDIATDPLTYLGGAGIAKKGASKVAEEIVQSGGRWAAKEATEKATQSLTKKLGRKGAEEAVAKEIKEKGVNRLIEKHGSDALQRSKVAAAKARRGNVSALDDREIGDFLTREWSLARPLADKGLKFAGRVSVPGTKSAPAQALSKTIHKGLAKAGDFATKGGVEANVAAKAAARSGDPEKAYAAIQGLLKGRTARAGTKAFEHARARQYSAAIKKLSPEEKKLLLPALSGDEAARAALGGKETPVRQLFDEMFEEGAEAGLNIRRVDDYAPRVMDPKVKEMLIGEGLLRPNGTLNREFFENARKLGKGQNKFMGETFEAASEADVVKNVNRIAKERLKGVDTDLKDELLDFFSTDPDVVVTRYIKGMARRVNRSKAAQALDDAGIGIASRQQIDRLTPEGRAQYEKLKAHRAALTDRMGVLGGRLDEFGEQGADIERNLARGQESRLEGALAGAPYDEPLGTRAQQELATQARRGSESDVARVGEIVDEWAQHNTRRAVNRGTAASNLDAQAARLRHEIANPGSIADEAIPTRAPQEVIPPAVAAERDAVKGSVQDFLALQARLGADEAIGNMEAKSAAWEDFLRKSGGDWRQADELADDPIKAKKALTEAKRQLQERAAASNRAVKAAADSEDTVLAREVADNARISDAVESRKQQLAGVESKRAKYGRDPASVKKSAKTQRAEQTAQHVSEQLDAAKQYERDTIDVIAEKHKVIQAKLDDVQELLASPAGKRMDPKMRAHAEEYAASLEDSVNWGQVHVYALERGNKDMARLASLERASADTQAALADLHDEALSIDAKFGTLPREQFERMTDEFNKGLHEEIKRGIGTPKETAELLKDVEKYTTPESMKTFMKTYDTAVGWLKDWQIATPGFTMRNLMGGEWVNSTIGGVKMANRKDFIKMMAKSRDPKKWEIFAKANPEKAAWFDQARGSIGFGQAGSEFSSVTPLEQMGGSGKTQWVVPGRRHAIVKAGRKFNESAEFYLRGTMAYDTLAKGGTIDDAVSNVAKYHFDYDDLSKFESGVVKRVIPFYTWSRKNLPLQVEQFTKNPKYYNRINFAQQNIEAQSEGDPIVPDYFKQLMAIRTPLTHEGGHIYLTPDLPVRDLARFSKPSEAPEDILSMVTPLLKTPAELAMNKQVFKGIPLTDKPVPVPVPAIAIDGVGPALEKIGKAKKVNGEWYMKQRDAYALEQNFPMIARFRRFVPKEEKYKSRQLATVLSTVFGIGIRTNTKDEQETTQWLRDLKNEDSDFQKELAKLGGS